MPKSLEERKLFLDSVARSREHAARVATFLDTRFPAYRDALRHARDAHEALAAEARLVSAIEDEIGLSPIVVPLDARLHASMLAAHGYRCAYCGVALPIVLPYRPGPAYAWSVGCALDHIDPRVGGGSSSYANYAPACRRCNTSKGGRRPEDWSGPR